MSKHYLLAPSQAYIQLAFLYDPGAPLLTGVAYPTMSLAFLHQLIAETTHTRIPTD